MGQIRERQRFFIWGQLFASYCSLYFLNFPVLEVWSLHVGESRWIFKCQQVELTGKWLDGARATYTMDVFALTGVGSLLGQDQTFL